MMMMMIGDTPQSNPTVHIPPDPTAHIQSLSSHYDSAALSALQRFLPSNNSDDGDDENPDSDFDFPADAFSCDDFRMFDFKVKKCARARSHDWTECPFAHPGEKARRRDPRRYHYSGGACPDYRRGACRRGDACEHAHGVFECWLHPARYRTQPCKDGTHCRRRICFFAHTPEQLRVLPYTGSPDAPPRRPKPDSFMIFVPSPSPALFVSPPSSPTASSPPVSPGDSLRLSRLTETMRGLQLREMKMGLGLGLSTSPPGWGVRMGSPRGPSKIRPGFMSLPSTPIRAVAGPGLSPFDAWGVSSGEEAAMERVESGKALREKIYAKIGQDNSLNWADPDGTGPDVEWVSDLVK